MKNQTITVDGQTIFYREAGDKEKVLTHPTTSWIPNIVAHVQKCDPSLGRQIPSRCAGLSRIWI